MKKKMINNYNEYQIMHQVEQHLWWYKVLHNKALNEIVLKFGTDKNIKILDAGCGTGGMLLFLKKKGYTNIEGFDFSSDALFFCQKKNLKSQQLDITNCNYFIENDCYDVLICNDVLYQFDANEVKNILMVLQKKLNPNGLLISNNNAFNIFYGAHDIAVGSKQRFTISDFRKTIANLPIEISSYTYWSIILSPLILMVRIFQKIKIYFNLIDKNNIKSDLGLPNKLVNKILYTIVKTEQKILKKCVFGSSLFLTFQKKSI